MLWVFRVRDGRRIPVVLIDASTFEPVAYLRIDAATEGPISFIEATSSNVLVQAPNRALVITQVHDALPRPPRPQGSRAVGLLQPLQARRAHRRPRDACGSP